MDDSLKVEFPMGNLKIVVSEPTDGQLFALALSRKSNDQDRTRLVTRLIRVLEALTGPDQWDDVIEAALLGGTLGPEAVIKLAADVLEFDWAAHRKPVAATGAVPYLHPEPLPAAGPRVVSGG